MIKDDDLLIGLLREKILRFFLYPLLIDIILSFLMSALFHSIIYFFYFVIPLFFLSIVISEVITEKIYKYLVNKEINRKKANVDKTFHWLSIEKPDALKVIKKFVEKNKEYLSLLDSDDLLEILQKKHNTNVSQKFFRFYSFQDVIAIINYLIINLENLLKLLQTKYKMNIDEETFVNLIIKEKNEYYISSNAKKYERFENSIMAEKPKLKQDYIDALFKNYGEDSTTQQNIDFLGVLLNKKSIDNSDIAFLIRNRKQSLELDKFEKRLIDEEPKEVIDLDIIDGYEFESFLSRLFTKMGYNVIQTQQSRDYGADLVVEKFGEKTVVQAKRYTGSVGNKAIQEVVASKNLYRCDKAIVIITSYFTKSAINLAKSNNVELWARGKLDEMIDKYM